MNFPTKISPFKQQRRCFIAFLDADKILISLENIILVRVLVGSYFFLLSVNFEYQLQENVLKFTFTSLKHRIYTLKYLVSECFLNFLTLQNNCLLEDMCEFDSCVVVFFFLSFFIKSNS